MGREFNESNKPKVRYYNPDTFELMEEELPLKIPDITEFSAYEHFEFIQKCYCQEEDDTNYYLKNEIPDIERQKLIKILADYNYSQFLSTYNNELP